MVDDTETKSGLHKNYEHMVAVIEVLRQELTIRRIGDKVKMLTAKDIMATPVKTVNEDETLQKVWEKWKNDLQLIPRETPR